MPRELVTLQVGQCGNQIGCKFWEQALHEHVAHNPNGVYDDALSSFFKNVDTRQDHHQLLPVGDGTQKVCRLKARAVVVDMEEGVVNAMLKSPLGDLFDARSMLTDVSGAGNNWAHGFHVYGPQYREHIMGLIRSEAEQCDSLQGFLIMHSLGGGTGSGLGSYLLSVLEDLYPEIFRFTVSLFPAKDDDVITSPYNSLLALEQLINHASAVLPIDNQALLDMVDLADSKVERTAARPKGAAEKSLLGEDKKPFDRMNGLAASVLLNLTAGMRFEGPLNVDMNDIAMNMVPYPRMHFLVPSMSPLTTSTPPSATSAPHRAIDRLFYDVLGREHQLFKCDPRHSLCLACGLFARGPISGADVSRNIKSLKPHMSMAYWNQEGFKVGLCSKPPLGAPHSVLCLANSCGVGTAFGSMLDRFDKLFKRQVYVHHYTQYMDASGMQDARAGVVELQQAYSSLEAMRGPPYQEVYEPAGISFL